MGMFDTTGSPLQAGLRALLRLQLPAARALVFSPRISTATPSGSRCRGTTARASARPYAQNLIADDVLAWVRSVKSQPFFLFYAITLPHGRHEIDDLGAYADKPWTPQQKAYAAQVTRLDRDVGRLLDLLKELQLDEKTLVMVAGDNGSSFAPGSEFGKLFDQAANGLRGFKRSLYEGALRQAALCALAGRRPGLDA
jgi:arylsulfatase A-like enzyme